MVTTAEALEVLYPEAVPLVDYVVVDDGSGPQIAFWDGNLGTQPDQAALDAVTDQDVTDARRGKEPDLRDLLDQAQSAVASINNDLAAVGSATNTQVRDMVERLIQRQRRVVIALARLIQREWRG